MIKRQCFKIFFYCQGFSVANVESVVTSCQKQRFTLKTDETDGKLLIRANQVNIIKDRAGNPKP